MDLDRCRGCYVGSPAGWLAYDRHIVVTAPIHRVGRRGLVVRRAVAVIAGYWVYRTLMAAFVGALGIDVSGAPATGVVVWTVTYATTAAIASGYACAVIAGAAAGGATRLLATALAAIAVLALVQRFEQGLTPTWWLTVNLAVAPACLLGAALQGRHRACLRAWASRGRASSPPA